MHMILRTLLHLTAKNYQNLSIQLKAGVHPILSVCARARMRMYVLYNTPSQNITNTVKSRLLAAIVDKPQAQIMCQKPGKTLIPIDKPQLYFVDVV